MDEWARSWVPRYDAVSQMHEAEFADRVSNLLAVASQPSSGNSDMMLPPLLEVLGRPDDKLRHLQVFASTPSRAELNLAVAHLAASVELWHGVVHVIDFFDAHGQLLATLMLPATPEALRTALLNAPDLSRNDLPDDELFWQDDHWVTPFQ